MNFKGYARGLFINWSGGNQNKRNDSAIGCVFDNRRASSVTKNLISRWSRLGQMYSKLKINLTLVFETRLIFWQLIVSCKGCNSFNRVNKESLCNIKTGLDPVFILPS